MLVPGYRYDIWQSLLCTGHDRTQTPNPTLPILIGAEGSRSSKSGVSCMIRARPLSRTHARLGVAAGAAIAARDAVADTSHRSPPRRANCTGGKPEPRQGGAPPRPRVGAMVAQFPVWLKYFVQGILFKVFVQGLHYVLLSKKFVMFHVLFSKNHYFVQGLQP